MVFLTLLLLASLCRAETVVCGKISRYAAKSEIAEELAAYRLTPGIYTSTNHEQIAFLIYRPNSKKPVPLLLYIPGSGEKGLDLKQQFRQRTIFEKICSPEFQKRHPCYLLMLAAPKNVGSLLGGNWKCRTRAQCLMMEALMDICAQCTNPRVDYSRLYGTGLSFGGNGVYRLGLNFPDVFAAVIPVASMIMPLACLPEESAMSVWHIYNGNDYRSHGLDEKNLYVFRDAFQKRCGEFCVGTYPDTGHNAWDKAWREDFLWEWLFSKTNDAERNRRTASSKKNVVCSLQKASCTAKQEPCAEDYGAERAVDGLLATYYQSKEPMRKGDWIVVKFTQPTKGTVTILTGAKHRRDILKKGHVEVSTDGKIWRLGGQVKADTGECRFFQRTRIRFLKIVADCSEEHPFVIREVQIQ